MPALHLPVRPDLRQLRHQARDLQRAILRGDPTALAQAEAYGSRRVAPGETGLTDAQHILARCYGAPSWPRLVVACRLVDAIWRDDRETVRALVVRDPRLLRESALVRESSWGPPMAYAANLGRDAIVVMLHELGATDVAWALDRAALQGRIGTARILHAMLGAPAPKTESLGGPAYTLSLSGTALLLELGAPVTNAAGDNLAPVAVVLESDSRNPTAKHGILELYVTHGATLPDTPAMALHRGRIDLLEQHLQRDPGLLRRTFAHTEIYPPELGCHDEILATHGTPLAGATLLHMCADYDELEIARWLLARGMPVDAAAAVDGDGFGGHTALFATVVSQPAFWMNHSGGPRVAPFTALLLDHGASPRRRASLRKQLHPGYGEQALHEYRDVTPLSWGERFHDRRFVSVPAMRMIAERGGSD